MDGIFSVEEWKSKSELLKEAVSACSNLWLIAKELSDDTPVSGRKLLRLPQSTLVDNFVKSFGEQADAINWLLRTIGPYAKRLQEVAVANGRPSAELLGHTAICWHELGLDFAQHWSTQILIACCQVRGAAVSMERYAFDAMTGERQCGTILNRQQADAYGNGADLIEEDIYWGENPPPRHSIKWCIDEGDPRGSVGKLTVGILREQIELIDVLTQQDAAGRPVSAPGGANTFKVFYSEDVPRDVRAMGDLLAADPTISKREASQKAAEKTGRDAASIYTRFDRLHRKRKNPSIRFEPSSRC